MIYFAVHFISPPDTKDACLNMKQKLFCILFLFFHVAYAQTTGIDLQEKERQIKRTMYSEPDSAYIYIRQILDYKGKLHDTVYGNTYTVCGYYHHLKNNTDSALYYYNKALPFINEHKYPKLYGRILRNKAGTYKKRGEYEESLRLLEKTGQYYKNANDEKGIAVIYGEIASNYNIMLRSDEGISYLLKAISILEKTNDKTYILTIKLSLANTYLNMGNLDFAADLYKEVLKGYKEQNIQKNYSIALLNYGDCLMRKKKFSEAQKAFNDALPVFVKFNDHELIGATYAKLGRLQQDKGDLASAETYYNMAFEKCLAYNSPKTLSIAAEYLSVLNNLKKNEKALKIIGAVQKPGVFQKANVSDRISFEDEKVETYGNINNTGKVLTSLQNSLKLKDTLKKNTDNIATLKLQQEFQNKYQDEKGETLQSKNAFLKEELNSSRKATLIPLLGVCFVLITIIIVYTIQNRKNKKQLALAKAKKELLEQEYENIKNLNRIHKESIEHKKQELVSGMISLSSLEGNISRLIGLCKENPADLCIDSIKGQLQSLTSEKDYWNLFRKRFNETYAGFQENLEKNFPGLTKNDLFFCSLLKLNLPYKDMATLMQVSPETIVKKKYRVKKKMEIETEQELENILLNTPL